MKRVMAMLMLMVGLISVPFCLGAKNAYADAEESTASIVAEDVYNFTLMLKVPQVFENTTSQGYRKYKAQRISGKMYVVWLSDGSYRLEFGGMENQQFKIRGQNVKYEGREDRDMVWTRFTWIGNNKKNEFKTPTLCFYLELMPNYAISDMTEDNSFYLIVSGAGSSGLVGKAKNRIAKKFTGCAAGTQGCSCADHGHKSPTRETSLCGPSDVVSDVVATFGSWSATWKTRVYYK